MTTLRPGKGAHLTVTGEVLDFLADTLEDLRTAWIDGGAAQFVEAGDGFKVFALVTERSDGWTAGKDNFGRKLWRSYDWQGGEYRVTLVLNQHGEFKVDVRHWFDPDGN
jgi:hypothetical protein